MNMPNHNMNSLEQRMHQSIQNRIKKGTIRTLTKKEQSNNNSSKIIDFSSNDYLGLSRCTKQIALVNTAYHEHLQKQHKDNDDINNNVLGATGSRLLSGNNKTTEELEIYLSKIHNRNANTTLLFNSGYDANLSIMSSIPDTNDIVIFDELCHNSLFTGYKLSRSFIENKSMITFKHNDVNDLERLLIQYSHNDMDIDRHILIVLESVYSMDGDVAPISDISKLASEYNAYVIIDEAHAFGIYGQNGAGILSQLNLENHANILCSIYTFGKAAGCHGAIIACNSAILRDYLINYARPFIYSTALPLHSIISIKCAYQTIISHEGTLKRHLLFELVFYFRNQMKLRFFTNNNNNNNASNIIQMLDSPSPIQAIIIKGGNELCLEISCKLNSYGFHVYPIRSPTIPVGSERIRIILHSHNSIDQVKSFIDCLEYVVKDVVARGSTSNINNRSSYCTASTNLPTSQHFLPSKL